MRIKYLFSLLLVSVLLSACSRQNDDLLDQNSEDHPNHRLTGTWEWVRSSGGLSGNLEYTPASTGKTIELTFTADMKYQFHTNRTKSSEGAYITEVVNCIHDGASKLFINFSSPSDDDLMIERSEDEDLILSDEVYDGLMHVYRKKTRVLK